MTTLTLPHTHHPTIPAGLWGNLQLAANEPSHGTIYTSLQAQLDAAPLPQTPAWVTLTARVDPAQYRPYALPGIAEEQVVEGGQQFTVIRSQRGNYLRLTPEQTVLWHQMDGQRTVAQLATSAFMQFHQLLPVGDLVGALKQEGFLVDQPVGLYHALVTRIEDHTPEGWGKRVLRLLTGTRFALRNIDGVYSAIYRWFGWLLFTPVFAALWILVTAVGAFAFVRLFAIPSAGNGDGTLPLQIASLWFALLVSFLLHESAHALAVKHFRRTLRSGGMMLYFGAPAFYVDTSDIWRSPRRARVLVSAAGPMSDLFIGGIAAGYALLQPEALLAPVAAKLALTCYVATLFNINPLLELDGYYILVDLLRLPDLRRRALAFIQGPLWHKFTPASDHPGEWKLFGRSIQPFNREERIFTLYGVLTTIYAVFAIWFAVQFWRRWLWGAIIDLWAAGGWHNQLAAIALVLLVVVPIIIGLGFVAWGVVRSSVAWLIRRGYGRRPDLIAAVSAGVSVALALWIGRSTTTPLLEALPVALWVIAAAAMLVVRPDYNGAAIAPSLLALVPATILAGLAALFRLLVPNLWLWQVADGLSLLFLLLAAFAAELEVNVRQSPPHEQIASALMLMLSFGVGAAVVASQLSAAIAVSALPVTDALSLATPWAIVVAAPAYFGALALALLLPYLFSLSDSRLIWSWLLLWGAALFQTIAYVVDLQMPSLGLDILSAGLWAAAWITHLATLRQIAPGEIKWDLPPSNSERERLARAFKLSYAGCYKTLRAVYGARRTRDLDDRMDVIAATANWDVTLDRDVARIGMQLASQPLNIQGARFAEVLRYTVGTIEDIAGATFARRAIQAAYDALPWPERETASRLCFPDTPWARDLSGSFGDQQSARLRLLRDADFLLDCDDDAIIALASQAEPIRVRAGEFLLREGEHALGLWVIDAGEVLVKQKGDVVGELHRAHVVGETTWHGSTPSEQAFRASIDSSLLFIPRLALNKVLGERATATAEAAHTAAIMRQLERVPLFAQLSRNTLRGLAQVASSQEYPSRAVILRQGVPSGSFFVIQRGRAAMLTRTVPTGVLAADGSATKPIPKIVARLGPEEFFGELELLDGLPPRTFVVAETTLTVLMLPHEAVRALIHGDSAMARGLEQISTARLREIAPSG